MATTVQEDNVVITYTRDIPDAPNNPSVDQGPMKTNTNSIDTIIAVDHYTFADTPSGTHKQVTLSGKNAAGAQTDPASAVYTASGTASSVAQLTYRNQNGIFPLSCVRAWGYVQGGVGPVVIGSQSVNVSTVTRSSTGKYVITLTANAVSSNQYAVMATPFVASSANGTQVGYTVLGPIGQFELNFVQLSGSPASDPVSFTFMVLQI